MLASATAASATTHAPPQTTTNFAQRWHWLGLEFPSIQAVATDARRLGTEIELLKGVDPRMRQMAISKLDEALALIIAAQYVDSNQRVYRAPVNDDEEDRPFKRRSDGGALRAEADK
jgi:hypothetical protein